MEKKRREGLRLDPRAGLLLLALANVIMLVQDDPAIQISWIGCLTVLYLLCGRIKGGFQWLFVYLVLCAFQWMVLPAAPGVVISCFSIFINYARRMYPCMMIGWLILKTVSLREFIVALPRASRSADSHYTDFRDIAVFPCDPRGKRVYPGCHEIKKSAWRRKSGSLCCAAYDVGGQYGGRACGCGSDEGHRKSGKKDEYRQITDRSDGLHLHFGGSGIFGGSACCLRGGNV